MGEIDSMMILIPLFIFFTEGIIFFSMIPTTGSVWYDLMFMDMPMPVSYPEIGIWNYLLIIAQVLVFFPIYLGILIIKFVGVIGVIASMMVIPFSMMNAYPGLIWLHVCLVFLLALGVIWKIRILSSGWGN